MMMKLFCMLVGEAEDHFSVNVNVDALSGSVEDLKKAIKNEQEYKFPANKLKLYLAKRDGTWLNSNDARVVTRGELSTNFTKMDPSLQLDEDEYYGKNFTPNKGDIHVLVQLPLEETASSDAVTSERLLADNSSSKKWVKKFLESRIKPPFLPSVAELKEYMEGELPVKIGVQQFYLDQWNSELRFENQELLSKIFEADNATPCVKFYNKIIYRIADTVDPGDTETSFISFWDDLIRNVLNFVLFGVGKSNRNSNQSTSTGSNRPDYLFIVKSVCVFRGEEKAPGVPMEIPRNELNEKLIWSYGNVPYLFGYAAVGFKASLYAITHANASYSGEVKTVELKTFDLTYLGERFQLLLAILNIARLFESIAELCPESGRNEYRTELRTNGIKILLEPKRVVKCFLGTGLFIKTTDVLCPLYNMMKDQVPNTDSLVDIDLAKQRLVFEPRGTDRMPSSLDELFHVLRNVLAALVELHALSWMHRDIRWTNVIKCNTDPDSWFLIDFMDAAASPQKSPSGKHLSRKDHAPEIFNTESHDTAVDIWSLGHLIYTSGDEIRKSWFTLGEEALAFGRRLLHDDPSQRPLAAEALEIVGQLEEQYLTRKKRKIEVQ